MVRYRLLPLLMLWILFLFTGCFQFKKKAVLVLSDESNLNAVILGAQIAEEFSREWSIRTIHSRGSQQIQNDQVFSLLNKGIESIIIDPVDPLGVYPLIRLARKRGAILTFINKRPPEESLDEWSKAYFIGVDERHSGIGQALLVSDLFGPPGLPSPYDKNGDEKIQTICLLGSMDDPTTEARTDGFFNVIANNGYTIDLLAIETAHWSSDIAYERMIEILQQHSETVELIIANNDDMALGALQRMKETQMFSDDNQDGKIDKKDHHWIPVLGIGGSKKAMLWVESGYMYGTVIIPDWQIARTIYQLNSGTISAPEGISNIWIDSIAFSLK